MMTKEIPLTQGKFALVDDDMYDELNKYRWYAARFRDKFYVYRHRTVNGRQIMVAMHREVVGEYRLNGLQVDHINNNGLDNRLSNLRIATNAQNQANRPKPRHNKSGYKGVCKIPNGWSAYIMVDYSQVHLGNFKAPEDAAYAYDRAAKLHFGEFAYLNFPSEATK